MTEPRSAPIPSDRVPAGSPDIPTPPAESGGAGLPARVSASARLDPLDAMRGLVIALMVLDHVRSFTSFSGMPDPVNVDKTWPALFATRLVTHLCAPTFVFLAGAGVALSMGRGKSPWRTAFDLVTRGLWLIILELTVIRVGETFDLRWQWSLLQVIWVIGLSMVVTAPLVLILPRPLLGALGVGILVGHHLLDDIRAEQFGSWRWLWVVIHDPGDLTLGGTPAGSWIAAAVSTVGGPLGFLPADEVRFFVAYTLISWWGFLLAGIGYGAWLSHSDPNTRWRRTLVLGLMLLVGFLALRGLNRYGDPRPWRTFPQSAERAAATTGTVANAEPDEKPATAPNTAAHADAALSATADLPWWNWRRHESAWRTAMSFLNVAKYPPSTSFALLTLGIGLMLTAGFGVRAGRPDGLTRILLVFGRVPLFLYLLHWPVVHGTARLIRAVQTLGASPADGDASSGSGPPTGLSLPWLYLLWLAVLVALYPACRWYGAVKARHPGGWLRYL